MDNSKTILAKNIRYLMEQKQKTRTELCEALGVKYTTLSDWVNGKTYPRIDKIERMAAYFGVENLPFWRTETICRRMPSPIPLARQSQSPLLAWSTAACPFWQRIILRAISKHPWRI